MQRSGPGEYRGMKIDLASYYVASTRDNSNDPPARTLHLEFYRKSPNSGLTEIKKDIQ